MSRLAKTLIYFPATTLDAYGMAAFVAEWSVILDSVGTKAFDQAITAHIRASKFFPTVAELRDRVGLNKPTRKYYQPEMQ